VHHFAAKLKERVFGIHDKADLRFELSGNGVERPEGIHRQNSGVAASLELRNVRGLRHHNRGDRDEYGECPDQIAHRTKHLDSGATSAVPRLLLTFAHGFASRGKHFRPPPSPSKSPAAIPVSQPSKSAGTACAPAST